jgi:hypothetical protein
MQQKIVSPLPCVQRRAEKKQFDAAGFRDAAQLRRASDLDPLRDRKEFQELLAELAAKNQP